MAANQALRAMNHSGYSITCGVWRIETRDRFELLEEIRRLVAGVEGDVDGEPVRLRCLLAAEGELPAGTAGL